MYVCVSVNKSSDEGAKEKLYYSLMHSVGGVCSSLCPIRPIWSHCIGARAHTRRHMHGDIHTCKTMRALAAAQKPAICKFRALTRFWRNSSCNFYQAPTAKTFFSFRTDGRVCGGADISTSPSRSNSLTHSKGEDYVLLHTETLSVAALHGVNLHYLKLQLLGLFSSLM